MKKRYMSGVAKMIDMLADLLFLCMNIDYWQTLRRLEEASEMQPRRSR